VKCCQPREDLRSRMRDIETIDSELRLLLAIRQMVRAEEGRPRSTARIDELLDERLAHPSAGHLSGGPFHCSAASFASSAVE
jgi:hypothetical protein